jgi:hypothetical protein
MRSGNFSISFRRIPIKANCSERSSTYRLVPDPNPLATSFAPNDIYPVLQFTFGNSEHATTTAWMGVIRLA